MTEERIWLLVSLHLSGEANPDECRELEHFLQNNPETRFRADIVKAIWTSRNLDSVTDQKEAAFNKHLQRLSNHFSEPVLQFDSPEMPEEPPVQAPRRSNVHRLVRWSVAAAACLLVAGFIYFYRLNTAHANEIAQAQNTISTKRGSKSKVQLPDGTQVWLNADSKITYNENFQGDLREVQLSGEAFFDVVHDPSRPFVIHTNIIDLKVLGTAFNVRSYDNEKNTEASLIRGSIEVTLRNSPDKKFILKPNDKLVVRNKETTEAVAPHANVYKAQTDNRQALLTLGKINFPKNENNAMETMWVRNRLAFDGEPLEEIALKIERWYDVKVDITDERIKKGNYTVVFDGETLPQVMEALRLAGNFKYTITKNEVTIRP